MRNNIAEDNSYTIGGTPLVRLNRVSNGAIYSIQDLFSLDFNTHLHHVGIVIG